MTVDHLEINREYVSQFTDNALIAVIVYAICEKAKREKKTIREEIAHCVSRMEEEYTRLGLIDQVPPWGKG